jgi:hypothetical protein
MRMEPIVGLKSREERRAHAPRFECLPREVLEGWPPLVCLRPINGIWGQGCGCGRRSQVFPSPVPHLFGALAVQVCSTLSFSGSGAFGRMLRPFDVVIVDEAAQAVRARLRPPPQPWMAAIHGSWKASAGRRARRW